MHYQLFAFLQFSYLNGILKTASDGDLMATLRNNFFATAFYYTYRAKLETSAVFESKTKYRFNCFYDNIWFRKIYELSCSGDTFVEINFPMCIKM